MRDLFGELPAAPVATGTVRLRLTLHRESAAAWLLSPGLGEREAKWAPKSEVTRGEGHEDQLFTMPAWLAKDRGWT